MSFPPRQPARSEIAPENIEFYNFVIDRARYHSNMPEPEKEGGYYAHMLLTPEISASLCRQGQYFRAVGDSLGSFSHADREFVDQILGKDLKTNCVALGHINDAVSTGVRIEAIEAIRFGREDEVLNEDEKLLASFIRKVMAGQMDPATWARMEARIGERGAMEYAAWILYLHTTIRGIQLVRAGEEPSDDQVDQLIADIKSGKHVVDDYRKRIS